MSNTAALAETLKNANRDYQLSLGQPDLQVMMTAKKAYGKAMVAYNKAKRAQFNASYVYSPAG